MTINSKTQVELLLDGRQYSMLMNLLLEKYEKPLPYDDMALYRQSVLKKEINKLLILAKIEEIDQALLLCERNGCSGQMHDELERRRAAFMDELRGNAPPPEPDDSHIFTVKAPT